MVRSKPINHYGLSFFLQDDFSYLSELNLHSIKAKLFVIIY
ncbi:hypothetical protein VIC_002307 [Vibrio coralliilyticus ATCC BAA-450]|nr:hypothetical protein VIC_002307 [Vibrio coralliilyticus ATCC BAA-450]